MVLSEASVWNVQPIARFGLPNPLLVPVLLLGTWLLYVCVFALFAAAVHRFRVHDPFGLLLLGMLYGLAMEGVFADKVFVRPGLGPSAGGLVLLHLAFPALSFHAVVDFLGSFWLFRALQRGGLGLGRPGFEEPELSLWLGVCLLWCGMAYGPWHLVFFKGPVPALLQGFVLVWAFAALWLALRTASACAPRQAPDAVLTWKEALLPIGLILLGLALRARILFLQGRLEAFLSFLGVAALFAGAFALHLRRRGGAPEGSAYSAAFPAELRLDQAKLAKLVLSACAVFALARAAGPVLQKPMALFCLLLVLACAAFAAAFPLYAAWRLTRGKTSV